MKLRSLLLKSLAVSAGCLLSQALNVQAAPFTSGNLVVLRVGDGGTTLGTAASAVSLAEYTTATSQGSPVQTISVDSTAAGLTLTGNSATQGTLNRSTDGTLLTFGGYRKAAGGTNPQSDTTATTNRVVGYIGVSGSTPNVATAVTDGFSADSFRSVITVNGSSFYLSGAGASASGGVRYLGTVGSATTSVPINNGNTGNPNTRQILILGGNIYLSSGAGNPGIGVHKVGAGLPTSGPQTYTGSITTTAQIQSFYFTNLGSGNNWASSGFDTVYTADGANLSKFSFNGTSWALNNAVAVTGIGNIIGTTSGSTVTLYGTDTTASTGRIISLTDTAGFNVNNNGSATTLATAGTNYAFRGISFAPVAVVTPVITGTATAAAFTTTYGTVSEVQTFPVTGSNLSAKITATAPAGFEVSSDGTAFASTASFVPSSGSVTGSLSVRLSANAAVLGNLNSQNIALTSAGATTVNVTTAATGNIVSAKALTVTANDVSKNLNVTLTGGAGSTAFTSSGLANSETIGTVTITYGAGAAAADPAGTYVTSVVASLATGGSFTSSNYAITYMAGTITVNPAASLTISGLTADNKPYDRTISATLSGTPTLVGVLPADVGNVTLSGTPVATFASAGFGNGIAVTVTGYTLSGSAAGSYVLSQPTGLSANITQLALTVSGAAVTPKPFDGNTNAIITGTLTGVIAPDVVTFNGSGNFVSSAIGTGIAVTSTSTIGGANAGNYVLTQLTGLTGDITAPTLTSVDLSNYVRVGRHNLPEYRRTALPAGTPVSNLLCDEASGVAYNWDTDTLFICGDGGRAITQVTKSGQLVDTMTLELNAAKPQGTEFYDPEGITYIGGGQFVFSEERERQLVKFTYVGGTTLTRAAAQTVDLGTFDDNTGTEGMSWDPQTNGFIVLKEKTPIGVFQTSIDWNAGTATNGSPTTVNSTNLFDTTLLGMTDVADVFALSNLPSMTGQAQAGNLLILGQENARVVNVDRAGNIVSTLNITSDVGNPLSAADQQPEGITMDRAGNIYVVNENGGGSIEFPQLWVYAPSTVPNAAPTAVVLNNAVNSLQENTSTASPIKVGDIVVTDDGLGTNALSLTGADAASFQITGSALYLKSGAVLDFETKTSYAVTINADDTTVGSTPDVTVNYTLSVTDQVVETPAPPALIVTEVAPWASSNGIVGGDWFEVTNVSANAVDITGWKIDDSSNAFATSLALTGITSIAAGESVIFLESTVANQATIVDTFKTVWFGGSPPVGLQVGTYQGSGAGLSTGGDAVNLFTAGGTRHSGVSFGAADVATPFQTFDNTAAANDTAIALLSTVGVNGAFAAATSSVEIGSPGISNPGVLRVTEVAPWSSGNSPVVADWFEVTNTGARAVDITGWKVDDSSESPAAALALVGITSIAPGESVIFLESATPVTTKAAFLSNWFGASPPASLQVGSYTGGGIGLSTGGDAVNLYDTNNVRQANVSFGLSPSTAPFTTFDNAAAANVAALTQFSVVGVNGAFVAVNSATEVGSPGGLASAPIGASVVSIAAASVNEGNSGTIILNLPVTRTNTSSVFTVNYAVTGGTATAGTDYTLAAGTLSFTFNGAATQDIAVTVNGDTTIESNEVVTVTLSGIVNANGTTTLGTATANGTVTNDDTVPNSFPSNGRITSTVKGSIDLDAAPLASTNGAEIPAFDPLSKRAFTSSNSGIQVINLTNPAAPAFINTIAPASLGVAGLTSNDVSSVTVRKGTGGNPSVLAAAIISSPKSALGFVIFINPADGALIGSSQVGANPDHIAFSPDGTKLLVANEGELDAVNAAPTVIASDTTIGSVSIISVPVVITGVPTSLPTATADFTGYDSQSAALSAVGVRIFQGGKPSTDFEPEYFAISADSTKALVTLQEANAVATLDLATATFTSVVPLGKKNFATGRHDFSDRDGLTVAGAATTLVNPTTGNPVFGLYMPDAVASYSAAGQTYYITANEGDDRNDFLNPDETTTVGAASGYTLDPTVFPNASALKNQASLGRLTVSNATGLRGDTDGDGDIDEILSYGGRSFSILDSTGAIIWDSGDMIENIIASQFPSNFDDTRSDNKGPEPEGVTVATLGSRTYAFIGLERSHMTLVFDVTNPAAVTFAGGLVRSGDLNPEGLVVVSAADSPTGKPLLLQASEVSQTLTVFELNQTTDYTLQVLHYYGESGLLGIQTAPIMGAMIDRFDDQYANTVVIGEGDSFIPGPWLVAGADPAFNALLHTTAQVYSGNNGALGVAGTFNATATATTAVPFARADIAIMNAFGTTVSALGNHEFDLGSPVLASAIYPATTTGSSAVGNWVGAKFPHITANLDFSADSSLRGRADLSLGGVAGTANNVPNVNAITAGTIANLEVTSVNMQAKIAPYAIKTINGQRIGFVGATTFDLLSKSSPNGTVPKDDANASTSDLQEVAAYLQAAVNSLQALGVTKIIQVDQLDTLQRNKDLAPLVSGIDIVVAGGGHERMGDATDVPVGFNGHDADFVADAYPIVTAGADGRPVLIVTTDTEYTYLGRLVADFDADGTLIVPNLNPVVNGAYASTEANLQVAYATANSAASIIASSTIGSQVKTIIDAINTVVVTKDSNVYGYTNVYLEGDRVFGRTQEVNLGNITADANAWKGRNALGLGLGDAVFSLKNGGGIRASLGSVLANGTKVAPIANPLTGKLAGGISQLDVENALRFDNKLMVFDATPLGLKNILEFASGLSSGPTVQSGGYAQVGNIRFSYNSALTSGSRLRSAALVNEAGQIVAKIVENGVVLPTAPATIKCVALSFTANGGDNYPIKYLNPPTNTTVNSETSNFRLLLTNGGLSDPVARNLDFTAASTYTSLGITAADVLGEQKAFQDFLAARHPNLATAYNIVDTTVAQDTRIQQLAFRSDTVLSGPATFASWLAANGFSGNASGDSDNDGVPDSLEYFFNANPNSSADRDNLPALVTNGSDLEFRFTYLNTTTLTGFLQCSADLTNWVNATPGVDYEVISETVNGVETTVRYRVFSDPAPVGSNPAKFFKIAVPGAP